MKMPRRVRGENPCKHCDDREVGCHAGCDKYLNWRNEYQEAKQELNKARSEYDIVDDFVIANKQRNRRRRGR